MVTLYWSPFTRWIKGRWNQYKGGQQKKLIPELKDKTYEERLRYLKIPSLVYRRKRGDMIFMYKIMNGLVRLETTKLFVPSRSAQTRGHAQRVFKNHSVKATRCNSFSQVVNNWNHLPNYVVEEPSINALINIGMIYIILTTSKQQ